MDHEIHDIGMDLGGDLDELTPAKRASTDESDGLDQCASVRLLKKDIKKEKEGRKFIIKSFSSFML